MDVFVTGGTGYIGRALIPPLLARGHRVRALTRAASTARVPTGATAVIGDALDASSFAGETAIVEAQLTATIVRPWYVIGPGHWWPLLLSPLYQLAEWLPVTRATARRLGLVTLAQIVRTLIRAVEAPPAAGTQRIVDVPEIRSTRE